MYEAKILDFDGQSPEGMVIGVPVEPSKCSTIGQRVKTEAPPSAVTARRAARLPFGLGRSSQVQGAVAEKERKGKVNGAGGAGGKDHAGVGSVPKAVPGSAVPEAAAGSDEQPAGASLPLPAEDDAHDLFVALFGDEAPALLVLGSAIWE